MKSFLWVSKISEQQKLETNPAQITLLLVFNI